MDTRTILVKIITLIYKSRLLDSDDYDTLIRTVLDTIKVDQPEFNFLGNNSVKSFKDLCINLLSDKDPISKEILIQQLSIILENDNKLLQVIKDSILPEHDEASNKRIITNLVKNLNNYYREQLAINILSKVTYDLKFNRNKINNFSEYLQNTITELEPLSSQITTAKDPALVNEVDFENPDSLNVVFDEVKNLNNHTAVYKTGWQALNKMTQGGFRRGECITFGALQHNFKTGFSLSTYMHVALHNNPILTKEEIESNKKPLLLRISFEDSLTNNLQFMYQYLKSMDGDNIKPKDFESISTSEMSDYILKKLTATGFHIKMLRIDPSQWTYSHVINKVIEYEAQGYSVHMLMLDYITMLPTTGCTQGPTGSDKRDLLRRMRNFCSARKIIFATPLQLSSEAKQMLRNGVPGHQLVKEICNRGYYDGAKSLDQEIDLELYINLFSHNKKKFVSVQRGKHRLPTVVEEDDLYYIMPFPNIYTPILGDVDREDTSMKKIPKAYEDGSSNLLTEVLN